ncbi:LPS translocon maturation chaperone LptM [Piscinibacter terrae]|uniref:Lipoprotein-attachment site-containing protein n=1 Tax=Piscinibacter terrae TaxID=2496871 RepID=A0A3N7HVK2_9BURK|nr:hypothetical protein DZC73_05110 [Albitalea terrae]
MLKRHRSLSLGVVTTASGLLAAVLALSACGQKGPLTLAQPSSSSAPPAAASASSPASSASTSK